MSTHASLSRLFDERFSDRALNAAQVDRFRRYVADHVGRVDAHGEGYLAPEAQRDLSIRFHWGHNHRVSDDFVLNGRMGDRHIDVLARFMDEYGLENDLSGKTVLDIGCWTGGTALLLAALGARVVALEEVRKYADTVNFLADLFGLGDRLACVPESLYPFLPRHADVFDIVLYAGVIYHVTDPLLSLRLIFGALKDGGRCFLESAGFDHPESLCRYQGPEVVNTGSREDLSRSGWNYFIPTPTCAERWCRDAGFQEVRIGPVARQRLHGVATRTAFRDLLRAGLSRPDCR